MARDAQGRRKRFKKVPAMRAEFAWAWEKGEHSGSDIYSNRAGCPVTAKTAFHLRPSGSICFF